MTHNIGSGLSSAVGYADEATIRVRTQCWILGTAMRLGHAFVQYAWPATVSPARDIPFLLL